MPSKHKSKTPATLGAGPQTRLEEIYYAAVVVFLAKGYDPTTLQDVASDVGLTKAGLYHYIRSKEELLFGVMNYAMDRVDAEVVTPSRAIADPARRLKFIAENYGRLVIREEQDLTLIFDESRGLTPAHRKVIAGRRRAFYRVVKESLAELVAAGRVPPVDASLAALNFFGMIIWMARWYRPQARLDAEQLLKAMTEMAINRLFGIPKDDEGMR